MKKHCTNNLAIIVLLGLFSSTLTYGKLQQLLKYIKYYKLKTFVNT